MTNMKKIVLGAFSLLMLAGAAHAAPTVLDRGEMKQVRGEGSPISNGALKKNKTACSKNGGSSVNCRPGATANPFKRGCSAANRCKRD